MQIRINAKKVLPHKYLSIVLPLSAFVMVMLFQPAPFVPVSFQMTFVKKLSVQKNVGNFIELSVLICQLFGNGKLTCKSISKRVRSACGSLSVYRPKQLSNWHHSVSNLLACLLKHMNSYVSA